MNAFPTFHARPTHGGAADPTHDPKTSHNLPHPLSQYGRRIQIVDADEFTREWMENEGIPLSAPLQPPEDEAPKLERILPPYTGWVISRGRTAVVIASTNIDDHVTHTPIQLPPHTLDTTNATAC